MIEEYRFGYIKILGKSYNYDVEVRWTGEVLSWWRKESHIIDLEDIQRALSQKPELIIVGTGAYGVAKLTERAKQEIEKREIELIVDRTGKAVKTFNIILEKEKQKRVIGLFHLTC